MHTGFLLLTFSTFLRLVQEEPVIKQIKKWCFNFILLNGVRVSWHIKSMSSVPELLKWN